MSVSSVINFRLTRFISATGSASLFLLFLFQPSLGRAQSTQWTGAGDGTLWSDANNWSAGVPATGSNLVLSGSSQNNLGTLNVEGLYLVPTLGGQTITGNALNVGSTGILNLGQAGSVIENNINFSGNSKISGNSGQIFEGTFTLGTTSPTTLTLTGRGMVLGGILETQSSGLLLKRDANWVVGDRTLSDLTGTIRIEGGALTVTEYPSNIAHLNQVHADVELAGGYLRVDNDSNLMKNLKIEGTSNILKNEASVQVDGALTGTGTLNKYGEGDLIFAHGISGSSVNLNIDQGNLTLLNSSGTYSGKISGNGSVTLAYPGEATLTGQNTYTGGTTVTTGAVLVIDSDSNMGARPPGISPFAPTTPPSSVALLNVNNAVTTAINSGLTVTGAGTLTLGSSISIGNAGTLTGGTLTNLVGGTFSLTSPTNISGGSLFVLNSSSIPTILGTTNALGVGTNSQIASDGLKGSGALIKGTGRDVDLTQSVTLGTGTFQTLTNDGVRSVTGTSVSGSTPGPVTDVKIGDAGFIIVPDGIVSDAGTVPGSPVDLQPYLNSIATRTPLQQIAYDEWNAAQSTESITTTAGQAGVTLLLGGTLKVTSDILTYRSFDLPFMDGVIDVQSTHYYIAGNLTGGGRLVKKGAGLLTLAGESTLTGGMLVSEGALLGNSESLKGNIETASGTSVFFEQNNPGTYTGSLSGTGSFIKVGQSSLQLTGNSQTFAGTSWVLDGTLAVNERLGGDLVVGEHGTLKGIGMIAGNVINYGTISPGNSPGTINIGGNLTLTPSSILQMEVNGFGLGQYDQIHVGGAAILNGNLQLVLGPGVSIANGQTIQFITAAGGLSGQFTSVTSNLNNALSFEVTSTGTTLTVKAVQRSFIPFAITVNQRAVAANIDSIANDARGAALIKLLNSFPGYSLANAYDQIAPEELGAMNNMALSYNSTQHTNIERRLADIRNGSRGFSANGLALLDFDSSLLLADNNDLLAKEIASNPDKSPMRLAKDNRWGVFATGTGQFGDVNANSGASGYDFTTAGMTLGVDYRVTDQLAVGLSLGYADSSADLGGSGGNIDANRGLASLYGTWFSNGFYINGVLGGGGTSYDSERNVLGGKANGSTEGADLNAILGGGYEFRKGSLTFGPANSLEYSYLNIAQFTESGSPAPLQIQEQENNSLRSRLGLNGSYDLTVSGLSITPTINLAWQHEFFNPDQGINAQFANGAGSVFGVQTAQTGRDSALAGMGVNLAWNQAWSSYLSYDAEVSPDFISHTLNGGVKFRF